jgi:hypothetical protein
MIILKLSKADQRAIARNFYKPKRKTMTSWKPEVRVGRSETWSGNAVRTATREEAEHYARDLCMRWTATSDWRVVESEDPVSAVWKDGKLEFIR